MNDGSDELDRNEAASTPFIIGIVLGLDGNYTAQTIHHVSRTLKNQG